MSASMSAEELLELRNAAVARGETPPSPKNREAYLAWIAKLAEEAKKPDPWNRMSTVEIFAELPPYPWLVKGIHLAPGRVTLLNGYADVGKTVIAMTVALSVAAAVPLWGVFEPTRTGKVLHLNGELGSYIARERYQRLARGSGVDVAELAKSGNLVLSNYPEARLDDEDFEDKLASICDGFALVVMDSLRAFSGSLDENKKEIGVALFKLARVSHRTGATILVLHHNRKTSKDSVGGAKESISGSGSILGGAECAFVMTSTDKGGPILVQHERSPTGRPLDDFGLCIEDIAKDGDPRWGLQVVHMEPEQMEQVAESARATKERATLDRACQVVLDVLERHAGQFCGSRAKFRTLCKIKKTTHDEALADLEDRGLVRESGTYHRPEWHLVRQ